MRGAPILGKVQWFEAAFPEMPSGLSGKKSFSYANRLQIDIMHHTLYKLPHWRRIFRKGGSSNEEKSDEKSLVGKLDALAHRGHQGGGQRSPGPFNPAGPPRQDQKGALRPERKVIVSGSDPGYNLKAKRGLLDEAPF